MRFTNVGGSLGSGALLIGVLWSLHCYAAFVRNRPDAASHRTLRKMARLMARITPSALKYLVEQDVVLTTIIDLRPEDQMATSPLPTSELFQKCTAAMPVGNLAAALKDSAAWKLAFPDAPPHPTIEHILVFVTPDETVMEEASAIAVTYNYQRCLHLSAPASEVAAAALLAPTFIERDAAAHLLALQAQQSSPVDFVFIDLRRHDERAMYGGISGSVHIPVETFAFAVQKDDPEFEAMCHVPKPSKDQVVVMQCRSNRRAGWAAQLAVEQGYERVFVYKQGSYGWRVDPQVKAYTSYEAGDEPPETEEFEVEEVDADAAVRELRSLGILPKE